MLAARALARRNGHLWLRTNATLASESTSASATTPPAGKAKDAAAPAPASAPENSTGEASNAKTVGRRKNRHRAPISLAQPRKWNRPIAPGVLPAYDEALKYIEADSARLRTELSETRTKLENLEKNGAVDQSKEEEIGKLREKVGILEVQSEVNRPSVRWAAANGMADLTQPVFRHLVEQKWRRHGALDLLMERIYQMGVVPDLLPEMHPSFDLRVSFPEAPPTNTYQRTRTKRREVPVEPGVFLLPEQTRRPPQLYTSVFHPETRYYTLVMLDADVPDPSTQTYTTYLHWLEPNIPLSASTSGELLNLSHTKYIPPHPQRGSPYHRYCLFLLPHKNAQEKISVPSFSAGAGAEEGRRGFDLREFCEKYGVEAGKGGACHMWREVWDETVSDIYKHTLKLPEPKYGMPPRPDKYAEIKALKKLTTTANVSGN